MTETTTGAPPGGGPKFAGTAGGGPNFAGSAGGPKFAGSAGGLCFAGYASVFELPDRGRDVVAPGAFARWLAERRPALPLLWQHEAREPVGRVRQLAEDARGLRVVASLAEGCGRGRDAAALLRTGALTGLSIGYRVRRAEVDPRRRLRRLTELELIEISLVTFPMQPAARVLALDDSLIARDPPTAANWR